MNSRCGRGCGGWAKPATGSRTFQPVSLQNIQNNRQTSQIHAFHVVCADRCIFIGTCHGSEIQATRACLPRASISLNRTFLDSSEFRFTVVFTPAAGGGTGQLEPRLPIATSSVASEQHHTRYLTRQRPQRQHRHLLVLPSASISMLFSRSTLGPPRRRPLAPHHPSAPVTTPLTPVFIARPVSCTTSTDCETH